jgi:hypothetical protein
MGRARVVAGAVALLLAAPLIAAGQGLGDASKKEKARREQAKAPKAKTYTQEDLAILPPIANVPDSASGEPATPAATGEPTATERASDAEERARQNDETMWRGRVNQARARVERARQAYQKLAGMNLVPGYEYQDERGRTVIASIEQLQGMTAAAKAELDAAEKALADLLEEARRANVPPGWLR